MFHLCPLSVYFGPFYGVTPESLSRATQIISNVAELQRFFSAREITGNVIGDRSRDMTN